MTERLGVDPAAIGRAAELLAGGGIVAFPTETVYGLGANAFDAGAVAKIFAAKSRPEDDPLIVHVARVGDLDEVASEVPDRARALANRFWPGPLTVVVPKKAKVPPGVTAGLETVAVRVPAHPVALALLEAVRFPVVAPSANRFGRASPTAAQHVLDDLDGRIDAVLDGGATTIGVESTVVDLASDRPRILRPGGVPREAIEAVIGPVELVDLSLPGARSAPGMLPEHYAVRATLVVVQPLDDTGVATALAEVERRARRQLEADRRIVIACPDEDLAALDGLGAEIRGLGPTSEAIARQLFAVLRQLEADGFDVIVVRSVPPTGLGLAIADRLRRAASELVVTG